jgi:hypothetical protein
MSTSPIASFLMRLSARVLLPATLLPRRQQLLQLGLATRHRALLVRRA